MSTSMFSINQTQMSVPQEPIPVQISVSTTLDPLYVHVLTGIAFKLMDRHVQVTNEEILLVYPALLINNIVFLLNVQPASTCLINQVNDTNGRYINTIKHLFCFQTLMNASIRQISVSIYVQIHQVITGVLATVDINQKRMDFHVKVKSK